MRIDLIRRLSLAVALSFVATTLAAQNAPLTGLDGFVAQALHDFKVPGLAIAIVRNDSIVLMKGYGTRTMEKSEPVDEHTIFAIGSASKAFTATLVAMMVDAGQMRWDDPATKYLPELQMYDPYVSRELTVRDLLTHRSGLARGDMVWFAGGYDRDEVLRRVRFLQPSWSMRQRFGYQNIMYLAAGQAVARVGGKSWDDLLRERILEPLGMTETISSTLPLTSRSNVATPHADVSDTLHTVPWHNIDNAGPAGSINSNVSDMIKWVRFQLANGQVNGKPLIKPAVLAETHSAQMVIPISADTRAFNPFTHLNSYGMGWFLDDYRGRGLDHHGGNIDGMSALVAVMPEENIGVVILTNANGSPVPRIVLYRALDALLGAPPRDWIAASMKLRDKARATAKVQQDKQLASRAPNTKPSLALDAYAGVYVDSLYGDLNVKANTGKLSLTYGNFIDATLEHWHYDTFVATARNLIVGKLMTTFSLGADGKVKSVEVERLGTFVRRPEPSDSTRRAAVGQRSLR